MCNRQPPLQGPRKAPIRRRWPVLLAVLCWLAAAGFAFAAEPAPSKECQVKAAFVYNFLKFVEWPSNRLAEADSPLVIGVVGDSPMLAALEQVVKNRKINGRVLEVRPDRKSVV
jgi:hypothetical protein